MWQQPGGWGQQQWPIQQSHYANMAHEQGKSAVAPSYWSYLLVMSGVSTYTGTLLTQFTAAPHYHRFCTTHTMLFNCLICDK